MKHNNCIDCNEPILPKAKRCRPCHFRFRKNKNKGFIHFKCPVCRKYFYKLDRGNIKNGTATVCSQNCNHARLSASKHMDPERRRNWAKARHRARSYIYKFGITPKDVPAELFILLTRSYREKEIIDNERLRHPSTKNVSV